MSYIFAMAQSAMLHVRIDKETKAKGNEVLEAIGLSASDAVRLLYKRLAAEQAFPIELKVPNSETRAAIAEARRMIRSRNARFSTPDALISDLETRSKG